MALASAIASSSVSKRKSGATGPKVSSLASRISVVAPVSTIGAANWPACGTLGAGEHRRSLGQRVVDMAVDLLDGGGVDQRADLDAGLGAGPDLHRPRPAPQPLGEGVVDAVLHQDAVGADAGLPGVAELRGDRPFHRRVEVGVVEDDEGRITAELEREPLHAVGADCAISSAPTRVEPVKEILRTVGLPVSSAPISAGRPVTTLMTPGRDAGALGQDRERQRRERREDPTA